MTRIEQRYVPVARITWHLLYTLLRERHGCVLSPTRLDEDVDGRPALVTEYRRRNVIELARAIAMHDGNDGPRTRLHIGTLDVDVATGEFVARVESITYQ